MQVNTNLFNHYKPCECCRKPIPLDYNDDYCPVCRENILFQDVKEFIRANEVNEYDVATYFNIPHSKVLEWIKQGRIEYKEKEASHKITAVYCKRCNAPITFGTICPKCLKEMNKHSIYAAPVASNSSANKMRFLEIKE